MNFGWNSALQDAVGMPGPCAFPPLSWVGVLTFSRAPEEKKKGPLRSCRPFTGVLFGEPPKVLWRLLSECFLGIPRKCPGECPPECPENWERSRSALLGALWGAPNFPGTLGGTFWESPQSTLKALAGALSGLPQKSTPLSGRQDLKKRMFLFFSCGATRSRSVPKTQALQVAFSLLERVYLRSGQDLYS